MMKEKAQDIHSFLSLPFALILITLSLTSCGSKSESKPTNDTVADSTVTGNTIVTETQFTSGDMELGKIGLHEFRNSVKANGMFDVPPENRAAVSAYFAGYIKNIKLLPGSRVKKGQVLFTLENPDYVQVQQDFLEAKGRLEYLKSDYDRQKELVADNVTSKKSFLKAESEYKVTLARYQSLRKKLSLMNINTEALSGENLRSTINVYAPISGFVTSINASKGMFLNPSDIALTIIDTEHLHLEINIFEKDMPYVKVGQPIQFRLQGNPDMAYRAKVYLVNKSIDPQKRTVNVHGHLDDESNKEQFAPGMYVETEIYTDSKSAPALPKDAVVNIDNDYFVLVKDKDSSYSRKLVKVGMTNNGYVQITNADDFDQNTEFLTKGAFNLITE